MKPTAAPISFSLLIGVTAVGLIGSGIAAIAAAFGLLPSLQSRSAPQGVPSPHEAALQARGLSAEVGGDGDNAPASRHAENSAGTQVVPKLVRTPCEGCGVIQTVREVFAAHGTAEEAGGIAGAQGANQYRRSHDSIALGVLGAVGGAFPRNSIERSVHGRPRYHVSVLMDDGTRRTVYSVVPPAFAVGEAVRVVDGTLTSANG